MAMTLRLDEPTNDALRARAEAEGRSMQEVVRVAVLEYIDRHSKSDLLEEILDTELPRYADALRRLGE
jgi:predicted transcriptional regulator